MHTRLLRLRQSFVGRSVARIAKLPVIREVLGAGAGMGVALAFYATFEFTMDLVTHGPLEAAGARLHAAAAMAAAQGTAGAGVAMTLALAAGCAYMQRRMVSRVA